MRARRHSAFTLVELMTVVAIVGVVAALAARMYSKGTRGESAPKFARTLMGTVLDARHMALTMGRTVSMTLDGTLQTVSTTAYDPNASTWAAQTTVALPATMKLCQPVASVALGSTVTPTCTWTGTNTLCFYPNGRATLLTTGTCSTSSPSTSTGATLYLETKTGDKNYRLVVWGLTGMVKLVDQW